MALPPGLLLFSTKYFLNLLFGKGTRLLHGRRLLFVRFFRPFKSGHQFAALPGISYINTSKYGTRRHTASPFLISARAALLYHTFSKKDIDKR